MPIPLLFIAAGAGTALFGVGKGVKAGIDQKEANVERMYEIYFKESMSKEEYMRQNKLGCNELKQKYKKA